MILDLDNHVETIRSSVSQFVGAEYEIMEARPGFPPFGEGYKWFMRCPFVEDMSKTAHANSLWENGRDEIWIESLPLGDTIRWVEVHYGEDATVKLHSMDLTNFGDKSVRKRLGEFFPIIYQSLEDYERILSDASRKSRVTLSMRYAGHKEIAVLFADAKIDARGLGLEAKLDAIKCNMTALGHALNGLDEYESKRELEDNSSVRKS
jgi:hypothetical protein